jgi:hypothetical protein
MKSKKYISIRKIIKVNLAKNDKLKKKKDNPGHFQN